MPLKLYGSPISPYVTAVRTTFAEKDINYEFVAIGAAELRSPEYVARHPFRKLPALDIDGQALFETSAIMRYADEAFVGNTALQPRDPLARARAEQWMSAANSYLYPDLFAGWVFQRAFAPKFGMPVDEPRLQSSIERSRDHLVAINNAIAAGDLGAADAPTLGDIFVAAITSTLQLVKDGAALLALHPDVEDWLNNLLARPSFAACRT
ncbi:MAG: glutathione S-transferase family protein [Pseudomonadota bacterium]